MDERLGVVDIDERLGVAILKANKTQFRRLAMDPRDPHPHPKAYALQLLYSPPAVYSGRVLPGHPRRFEHIDTPVTCDFSARLAGRRSYQLQSKAWEWGGKYVPPVRYADLLWTQLTLHPAERPRNSDVPARKM